MRFSELAKYLERLEATASRNEITSILAELFKKTTPEEIDKTVYLMAGRLGPSYQGREFQIAEKLMIQIIARAFGINLETVRKGFKEKGDLGVVAESFAKGRGKDLSVSQVFEAMTSIAKQSGGGSVERKVAGTAELLGRLPPLAVRYVARIPTRNLRLGFSDMTVLDALSFMIKGDKSARAELEAAFNVNVDIGLIAKVAKEKGLTGLSRIQPQPGSPIRPSLAERLPSAEKMIEKVGAKVAVEPKYDGFRAQVHVVDGKILFFSRNLENTTHMFPDLVEAVEKLKLKNAIFDAEAIAYDAKANRFLPFQETAQRKRKHGIPEAMAKFPLRLFVYDILYKDGKSLIDKPFSERRKILEEVFKGKRGDHVEITRQEIVDNAERIRDLIKQFLSEGLEGAIIKKIDAPYKAGARGYHWVKYKKTTGGGVSDTIDCLVMGVNKGKGKRAGFGVGAFLVGIKDREKFKTVSKIGTGLTDEQWRELNQRAGKLTTSEKPKEYEVDKNLAPDVWMKPELVVEILADEITKSPIHTAGIALRFPRLIRFRDDKDPSDSTSLVELQKLFELQFSSK